MFLQIVTHIKQRLLKFQGGLQFCMYMVYYNNITIKPLLYVLHFWMKKRKSKEKTKKS